MRRGKITQQIRAKKLRTQGRSIKEIARLLGVSKSSASIWVRNVSLGLQQRERLRRRELRGGAKGRRGLAVYWKAYHQLHPKPVSKGPRWPARSVESFFDSWTPEMAYVLGYFAADGCMYRNKRGSYYVGFTSTDYELIKTTKRLMGATNAIEEYQRPKPNCKRRYVLQIGSKRLFRRLLELGFTPHKSRTLKFPSIPEVALCHFVRGNLDGDGCVHVGTYNRKNRLSTQKIFRVYFTSGSSLFLKSLRQLLHKVANIGFGSLGEKDLAWDLVYSARDARQLYSFLYPTSTVPCLKRKREKFKLGIEQIKVPWSNG